MMALVVLVEMAGVVVVVGMVPVWVDFVMGRVEVAYRSYNRAWVVNIDYFAGQNPNQRNQLSADKRKNTGNYEKDYIKLHRNINRLGLLLAKLNSSSTFEELILQKQQIL